MTTPDYTPTPKQVLRRLHRQLRASQYLSDRLDVPLLLTELVDWVAENHDIYFSAREATGFEKDYRYWA